MTFLMTLHLAFVPGAAGARDDDAKENVFVFFKGFAKASSMSDGLLEPDLASKPLSVGRFSSLLPLQPAFQRLCHKNQPFFSSKLPH
jgi:hypothetical protein